MSHCQTYFWSHHSIHSICIIIYQTLQIKLIISNFKFDIFFTCPFHVDSMQTLTNNLLKIRLNSRVKEKNNILNFLDIFTIIFESHITRSTLYKIEFSILNYQFSNLLHHYHCVIVTYRTVVKNIQFLSSKSTPIDHRKLSSEV